MTAIIIGEASKRREGYKMGSFSTDRFVNSSLAIEQLKYFSHYQSIFIAPLALCLVNKTTKIK